MFRARLKLVLLLVMTPIAIVAGGEQLLTISRINPSAAPNLRQPRMVDPLRAGRPCQTGFGLLRTGGSWREVPCTELDPLGPSWGETADGGAWTLTNPLGMMRFFNSR